jgi:hypothetical protein
MDIDFFKSLQSAANLQLATNFKFRQRILHFSDRQNLQKKGI